MPAGADERSRSPSRPRAARPRALRRFTVTPTPKPTPPDADTRRGTRHRARQRRAAARSRAASSVDDDEQRRLEPRARRARAARRARTSGVVTGIALAAGADAPHAAAPALGLRQAHLRLRELDAAVQDALHEPLRRAPSGPTSRPCSARSRRRGYFSGTVNGDFGSTTETALEDWQGAQGLSQDRRDHDLAASSGCPRAPSIESWNVGLGGNVSSGTALATVDFPRDLLAEALVSQADVSSLKVGQKAALTIDGATSGSFTGDDHLDLEPARLVELVGRARRAPRVHRRPCARTACRRSPGRA